MVVDNGKIAGLAKAGSVVAARTAQTIDALDKYVVPGYLDMHAHVIDRADMQTTLWPLLIANGINRTSAATISLRSSPVRATMRATG